MIFKSFRQSLEALFSFRILLLSLVPPTLASLGLLSLFILNWSAWIEGLAQFLGTLSLFQWLQNIFVWNGFVVAAAAVFLILFYIPLAYLVATLLTSILVMPLALRWVVDKDFQHLEKRRGGSLLGSLWNTVLATVLFVILFFVTLPLWLLPGFQVLIPILLTAWLNKRLYLYDVLQDYASREERESIDREEAGPLLGMGLILGLVSYIPLAFFLVPVFAALSYTYYGLNALAQRRQGRF